MTRRLDPVQRITRCRAHPTQKRPQLADQALILSCGLLRANGMAVLEADWRTRDHRIGVVAKDGGALCFIAVIAHGAIGSAPSERLVDHNARLRLRAAAGEWLRDYAMITTAGSLRFDLICAVIRRPGSFELRHHKGVA
jgi:Holliday junction resolvase-like predicted endonuclease